MLFARIFENVAGAGEIIAEVISTGEMVRAAGVKPE